MESDSNADASSPADPSSLTAPVAQTIPCCSDGHHHHGHASLNNIGYQSLAMTAVASLPAQATPHAVARGPSSATKSSGSKNRKRKRTSRACVYCQKLHLSCDEQRPCIRCVKAGRADQCKDGKRKRRGRKRKSMPVDDEALDEDMDVDIDAVDGECFSHSEEEDFFDEEVSSSSATAPAVQSPRQDDDSVDLSINSSQDYTLSSPPAKRRAIGAGCEPSTTWRSPSELMADNDADGEVASMLLSLQTRAPAIKVFS